MLEASPPLWTPSHLGLTGWTAALGESRRGSDGREDPGVRGHAVKPHLPLPPLSSASPEHARPLDDAVSKEFRHFWLFVDLTEPNTHLILTTTILV